MQIDQTEKLKYTLSRSRIYRFLKTCAFLKTFATRERSCRYRSANSLAHELESHARSLAHISLAKMSVYVMSAPLNNWHTRGNQAISNTVLRGVLEGNALNIFFFPCSLCPLGWQECPAWVIKILRKSEYTSALSNQLLHETHVFLRKLFKDVLKYSIS